MAFLLFLGVTAIISIIILIFLVFFTTTQKKVSVQTEEDNEYISEYREMQYENEKEGFFARVQRVPVRGSRLDKIEAVNQLSREIESGMYTPEEAIEEVKRIKEMPPKSAGSQIFASGASCAAF